MQIHKQTKIAQHHGEICSIHRYQLSNKKKQRNFHTELFKIILHQTVYCGL